MNSITLKSYAKINLTLNVTGSKEGYHLLDSLVATVDLYDEITLTARTDSDINITMLGQGLHNLPKDQNTAYKAAKLFVETFRTHGADINIIKHIPVGGGVGGSSADAAGVLNGLASLYGIADYTSLKRLADKTGSDTGYMLRGGYARFTGRGDIIEPLQSNLKLHLLLLTSPQGVSSKECFAAFDRVGAISGQNSQKAVNALISGDLKALAANLSNDLYLPACTLLKDVEQNYNYLKTLNPLAVNLTGTGSGVYALFETENACAAAYNSYVGSATAYKLKTRI